MCPGVQIGTDISWEVNLREAKILFRGVEMLVSQFMPKKIEITHGHTDH